MFSIKKNGKRRRSSSDESSNGSFVESVATTVSSWLPKTISKWFRGRSTPTANGSAQTGEHTDSSSDDDASESPVVVPPQTKRMRYNSPEELKRTLTDTHFVKTVGDHRDLCNTIQTPTRRATFGNAATCVSTPLRTPGEDSPNDTAISINIMPAKGNSLQSSTGRATFRNESTCVSTPLRTPGEDSPNDTAININVMPAKASTVTQMTSPSVATKRKSLFDSTPYSPPAKRAHDAISSSTWNIKPPFYKKGLALGSAFYPGPTTYGGASAAYYNRPNVIHRSTAIVKESVNATDNTISHASRLATYLLGDYSSPLNDTNRMRVQCCPHECTASRTSNGLSHKTHELQVPSTASMVLLKRKLLDATMAARQILASHSSTAESLPCPPENAQRETSEKDSKNKSATEVKATVKRPDKKSDGNLETSLPLVTSYDMEMEKYKSPNDIYDSSTPKVPTPSSSSIGVPHASRRRKQLSNSVLKTLNADSYRVQVLLPETDTIDEPFEFSGPSRVSEPSPTKTPPAYTFNSPRKSIEKKPAQIASCAVDTVRGPQGVVESNFTNLKCPTIDCETLACSICKNEYSQQRTEAICANCEKNTSTNKRVIKKSAPCKWKCIDCWINNEETAKACVCCGAEKPKKSDGVKKGVKNGWDCEECPIVNIDNHIDTCGSCGAARPGSKSGSISTADSTGSSTSLLKKPDESFKQIISTQSDKWECPNCLVRNDNDKTKCVCCDIEKAGAVNLPEAKTFSFNTNTKTFKFGIDPKAQEANLTKSAETISTACSKSKIEESETNNNVLPNTPTFSFGVPAKKNENQIDAPQKSVNKAHTAEKLNFTFGISKSESAPPAVPIFGIPNKISEPTPKIVTEVKEKPKEIPKVDLAVPTSSKSLEPPKLMPMFGSPPLSKVTEAVPSLVTPSLFSAPAENKPAPIDIFTQQPVATSSEANQQQSTFTFTGVAVKPAMNLFGPPASTVASNNMFAAPLQTAPITATEPVFPMATVSPPMFNKPINTVSKPKFNFTNTSSSYFTIDTNAKIMPQTENEVVKSHTLGTGKTVIPMYGLKDDPQVVPKYTIADVNTIGFGNGSSGNALGGGGNGLPHGDEVVVGNPLSTNPLGLGHDMSSHPLSRSTASPAQGSIFGSPDQKEHMWSSSNNSNLFASNAATGSLPKAAFKFGASTPFTAASTPFTAASTPVFPASPSNPFEMATQNNHQSMFSSHVASPQAPMFRRSPASNPAPPLGVFGAPSSGTAPTFGVTNLSNPPFEAPPLTPAQAPAFNFGSAQTTGIFGFGQQQPPPAQQPQQPQQPAGVYNFAGLPSTPSQVHFNIGSAPMRRVRKALRRNTPR